MADDVMYQERGQEKTNSFGRGRITVQFGIRKGQGEQQDSVNK